jgi:hypothetical protein
MRSRFVPSPSLVLASLALAVALGGTAYAAARLPRNSVGSPQVKPNSLKGSDIKESTLQGLLHAQGSSGWARTRVLSANTAYTTLHTIAKFGRLDVSCGAGVNAGLKVVNTSNTAGHVWLQWSNGTTSFNVNPGGSAGLNINTGSEAAKLIVNTEAPKRVTVLEVATVIAGGTCTHTAFAETIGRS